MTGPLTVGVFPFGLAGGPDGLAAGPPDDLPAIKDALRQLQGNGPSLLARGYVGWTGADSAGAALDQISHLVETGLNWDLVLAYRGPAGDIAAWTAFVTEVIADFGHHLAALQVTGEANLTGIPHAGDGAAIVVCAGRLAANRH